MSFYTSGRDYKKLYEETLLVLSEKEGILGEKEEALAEKDHVIANLGFELDKLRRYIFGFKSKKRNGSAGDNQMGLFELGVTQSVQEELSCSVEQQKPAPKKRAKILCLLRQRNYDQHPADSQTRTAKKQLST